MISADQFYRELQETGYEFFTGVPDSLLKSFCSCLLERHPANRHVIAANEGGALSLAAGWYMAKGTPAVVYLQNSGLGNLINPLTSLLDKEIYSIPALLLVGWRAACLENGEQIHDEPQHLKMGRISQDILELSGVHTEIMAADTDTRPLLQALWERMKAQSQPVALLVRPESFAPRESTNLAPARSGLLSREEAIACIVSELPKHTPVVATTGMTGRELFEIRAQSRRRHMDSAESALDSAHMHERDFLTIGGMGHASQLAAGMSHGGISPLVCLDGDGAVLMHMGALAINANREGFVHIILRNNVHESVGGQPLAGRGEAIDFLAIARACGYVFTTRARTCEEIARSLRECPGFAEHESETRPAAKLAGASMIEIPCSVGHRRNLGRPTRTPRQNLQDFVRFLRQP